MALAVLPWGAWPGETRGDVLRWKLSAGEELHYTLVGKQVQIIKVSGRDKKSTRSNTTNLTWTVKSVSANGDAEIELRLDRVEMRIEQPPFMPLELDSSPNKLEIPEEFEIRGKADQGPGGCTVYVHSSADGRGRRPQDPSADIEKSPAMPHPRNRAGKVWFPNRA